MSQSPDSNPVCWSCGCECEDASLLRRQLVRFDPDWTTTITEIDGDCAAPAITFDELRTSVFEHIGIPARLPHDHPAYRRTHRTRKIIDTSIPHPEIQLVLCGRRKCLDKLEGRLKVIRKLMTHTADSLPDTLNDRLSHDR